MRRLLVGFSPAVVIMLVSGFSGGQNAQPARPDTARQEQQIPIFHAQSNMVLLDVVVTKGRGKPVLGLPESDFHVLENGQPQKISYFVEHKATDAVRVASPPENLPAGVYNNQPRYTLTSAADVILLDSLNTPITDQAYVRARLLKYLHSIPKGTRVAVFTLDSRLRMLQGFNERAGALENLLKSRRTNPYLASSMPFQPNDNWQIPLFLGNMSNGFPIGQRGVQGFQQSVMNDEAAAGINANVYTTVDALYELGRYLSTIPGRKNLIWFAGSFPPIMPGLEQAGLMIEGNEAGASDGMKKLISLLALARVAVYPVGARGLSVPMNDTAQAQILNPNLLVSTPTANALPSAEVMNNTIQEGVQGSIAQTEFNNLNMTQIATLTGGKAFENTNAVGQALASAIANGANYYTLGYVPRNQNDNGAYRKIRVRLEKGRYHLEYRRGYFALGAARMKKMLLGPADPLIAAMQPGVPNLSQVLFRAKAERAPASLEHIADGSVSGGKIAAQLKNPQRYVVNDWIDPKTLTMTKGPNGRTQVKLELTEVVYNPTGFRQNYQDTSLELNLAPDDVAKAMTHGLHLQQVIAVPEGVSLLRLGVQDLESGRIGTLEIPIRAGN